MRRSHPQTTALRSYWIISSGANVRSMNALLLSRWFPTAFQILFVIAMVAFSYLALQPIRRAETNPATAAIWTVWWPLLPFTVFFLGRLWCALCPAGAMGDWVQRLFPTTRPMAPTWVQKGGTWFALVGIAATGLAFLALALESNGPLTVIFLTMISMGAVLLALRYKDRVWCRWFCPLGITLGLYSHLSLLEVRADRVGNKPATGQSCPQFTSPVSHLRHRDCILCGVCVKAGEAVAVQSSWWFRKGLKVPSLTWMEALTVSLLFGLLAVDSLRMTPLYLDYMTWALPVTDNYRLALTLGGRGVGARRLFRELSLVLIPLVFALHLAISAQHLVAGSPGVLQGVAVELGLLSSGHLPPDSAYFINLPLKAFQIFLLALGVAGMLYLDGRWQVNSFGWRRLLTRAAPGLVMVLIFLQPMSAVC